MIRRVNLFFVLAVVVFLTQPAHAYLDGTTSSVVSQLFLGGLAGWMLLARLGWHSLVGALRRVCLMPRRG